MQATRLLLVMGLISGIAGCSGDGKPPLYPVKGVVKTMDGKPLVGAQVIFHPVDTSSGTVYTTLGVVDSEGNLNVTTFESGDGAPVGEYILTITWPTPRKTLMESDKDRLEGRYASKENSTLRFKVERSANNEIPLITVK